MSNRESGNRVSRAEMDVTEISPRKPFGFPGEDGSRRCSRDEEEEEGRRRVGEEEEDEEEDEDRLDVVGLDECSSSRPGRPFVSKKPVSSFRLIRTPVPSSIRNPVSVCPCVYEVSQVWYRGVHPPVGAN